MGRILHLQRLSTEDGPGIRTTVFFKGCSLRCAWCHNPESLSSKIQVQWYAHRCLGCCTCLEACPNGCLARIADALVIDRERCQGCGTCAQACPANAIETLGKEVSADELLHELVKDRAYYKKSGGGVTLSGGEPTLQPDFAEELLQELKRQGIATALDTCGLCSPGALERLLPFTDLVLYDLKLMDPDLHFRFTGHSNRKILDNLLYIRDFIRHGSHPMELWIRTPLIPGATDTRENLLNIGQFIGQALNGAVSRWELCAFNNLCRDKYLRLGQEWVYARIPLLAPGDLVRCEQIARSSGASLETIRVTGPTWVEHPV